MYFEVYDVCNDYSEELRMRINFYTEREIREWARLTCGVTNMVHIPGTEYNYRGYNEHDELIIAIYLKNY